MARKKTIKETNELTDITTEEVSIVDKAANARKFLVVKAADGGEDSEETVEEVVSSEDAAEFMKSLSDSPEPAPTLAEAVGEAPATTTEEVVAEAVVEAEKADAVLTEDGTVEAVGAELAEAGVQVGDKLDISEEVTAEKAQEVVIVADETPVKIHPATKKAVNAALEKIAERLDSLKSQVSSAEEDETSTRMPWEFSEGFYYLMALTSATLDMTDSMYGAAWEIEAAAVTAMAKSFKGAADERVEKIGRAISGARMSKMKSISGTLADSLQQLQTLISEVDAGKPEEEITKSVTIDQDSKLLSEIANLKKQLKDQEALLEATGRSNASQHEEAPVKKSDTFVWPSDMASAPRRR